MISVFRTIPNFSKRQLSCLVLMAAYGLLSLLVVCPSLHRLVHTEADQMDHHCAVTEMGDGILLSSPPVAVQISNPLVYVGRMELFVAADSPETALFHSVFERGPPSILHSQLL